MAAGSDEMDALRWHRRVLLVAAPSPSDPALLAQRHALAAWRQGAADRDLTIVELVADHVTGLTADPAALRARYAIPPGRFTALLIGKDGHVAIRAATPLDAETLERRIDAMPMRRAGQR